MHTGPLYQLYLNLNTHIAQGIRPGTILLFLNCSLFLLSNLMCSNDEHISWLLLKTL